MAVSGQRLLGAARDSGLIKLEDQDRLLEEARRARRDLLDVATSRLRLPREAFYRALAAQRGLAFREARDLVADPARLARVPARLLLRKGVLPIRAPEQVAQDRPDYLLLLAWNLRDEIVEQMAGIREWGVRFVVPIPDVEVFE